MGWVVVSLVAQTLVPNVEEVMNRGAEVKTSCM